MTLASGLLPALDKIRGIPGALGLRPYTVTLRVESWDGARIGDGTKTVSSTPIKVAGGTADPKVTQVSQRDALASAGLQTSEDLRVGPLTPNAFPASTIDPAVVTNGAVSFVLTGPGLPAAGALQHRIGHTADSALHVYVILRKTGQAP